MDQPEVTEVFLLRTVLAWYANRNNWSAPSRQGPYSSVVPASAVMTDGGKAAQRAVSAQGIGPLVLLVMDLMGQPLNELSRASGIDIPRLSLIIQGSEPTSLESMSLKTGVTVLMRMSEKTSLV